MPFMDKLKARWAEGRFVCVGLDPDITQIPALNRDYCPGDLLLIECFLKEIILRVMHLVAAFKPNSAFFEKFGPGGLDLLEEICRFIHERCPEVVIILDYKRADIENTNIGYVCAAFERCIADAVTVQPYLGRVALAPFLKQTDKGIFVLCRTSNPGAGEFQDLFTLTRDPRKKPDGMSAEEWLQILCDDTMTLYQRVASNVFKEWNTHGNCGLVTGATYPAEIAEVRKIAPSLPLLLPGIGRQQGDLQASVAAARTPEGGFLVNSSRDVLYPKDAGDLDFVEASYRAVVTLHEKVVLYLK